MTIRYSKALQKHLATFVLHLHQPVMKRHLSVLNLSDTARRTLSPMDCGISDMCLCLLGDKVPADPSLGFPAILWARFVETVLAEIELGTVVEEAKQGLSTTAPSACRSRCRMTVPVSQFRSPSATSGSDNRSLAALPSLPSLLCSSSSSWPGSDDTVVSVLSERGRLSGPHHHSLHESRFSPAPSSSSISLLRD